MIKSNANHGCWQFVVGWMNFAFAVPSIYFMLGMPLIMRQQGWTGTEIGLFQLAALPILLKFILALPIQHISLGKKHFVRWLWVISIPLILILLSLSFFNLLNQPLILFFFTLTISLLLTWLDIPLNALAVHIFSRQQQINTGSIRSAALFLAAIVGGGIMVLLHNQFGWQLPLILMAGFILIGLIPFGFLKISPLKPNVVALSSDLSLLKIKQDLKGFFAQPHALGWLALLILGFPFIGAVWLYLKPLLSDYGLSINQIALLVGVVGGIVGALSSIIAGQAVKKIGIDKTLLLYFSISILAIILLMIGLSLHLTTLWIITSALLVAVGMGGISALLFALTYLFTRTDTVATDYALQTTLFTLSRITVPILAGIVLDHFGQISMLSLLCLGVLTAFIICYLIRGRLNAQLSLT